MTERFSLPNLISDFHHDFRSVLGNLLGYVDHLLEGAGGSLTPVQEESLNVILKNAHRLKLMADNLARIAHEDEAGLISHEMVDLRKIAERSLHLYSLSARDAGIKLESCWEDATLQVQGSELQIGSLIDNLLSNAIKFSSPGGRVMVSGRKLSGIVELLVEDTGSGIPPDDLSQVFERGFRGTTKGGGRKEGLGLGLAICKRITEAHDARISITSRVGEGTRIEVIFPAV